MNAKLVSAEVWLNELGIRTESHPNCLKVSRDDVVNLGESNDALLAAMRTAVNHNKLFWANTDDNWLYLESF